MKGKVLILDDDRSIVAGLTALLRSEGIEAHGTSSPFELPVLLRREDPDVVLIDLQMPALAGETVLHLTRRHDMAGNAKVILYSGRQSEELARLTERLGADGFLSKSDDIERVLRRIEFWIGQRQATQQWRSQ